MAEWQGYQFSAYNWVLVFISLIVVLIRLFVDFKGIRSVSIFREFLVIGAWLCFLTMGITNSIIISHNWLNKDESTFYAQDLGTQTAMNKIALSQNFLVLPSVYLCKADLLLLFHQLSPRSHNPKMFWAIIFGWFCTIAGFLVQIFYIIFACPNMNAYWILETPACVNSLPYFISIWTTHMWSDLVVYVIPLVIIFCMQKMTTEQKLSAGAMFFMGFINIATSVICMVGLMLYGIGPYELFGAAIFCAMAQIATAIWIVCMPQIRSFWKILRNDRRPSIIPGKIASVHASTPSGQSGSGSGAVEESSARGGIFKKFMRVSTHAKPASQHEETVSHDSAEQLEQGAVVYNHS